MVEGGDSGAQWVELLRQRRTRDASLSDKCLRANVAQQLFGATQRITIAGAHFTIRRRLGAGAMGTVYEVEQSGRAGALALKVLHRAGSEEAYRLKREFRTLSQLGHPNLITLHELYADEEGSAFTMELVPGVDVLAYLRASGALALDRLTHVFAQLAEALLALHAQAVIHRDLKPSNVLVDAEGRVVLLDFGVALAGPERDVSGTASFMAPEQYAGRTVPESDLFALGVMLELALTPPAGAPPASGPEVDALWALSRQLQDPDPARRPSARTLLRELRGLPRPASEARAAVPFFGRKHELASLVQRAAAPALHPELVFLEGQSGIGKSALLNEFTRSMAASQPAALVLGGRCCRREMVRYRALDPLIDALSDALLHESEARLEALGSCVNVHLLRLFPVLERIPQFARHASQPVLLAGARERHAAAVAALCQLLTALCRTRRVVLCVDDAHWLDQESFELIRELLEGPHAPPLLWIFAARPHAGGLHRELAARARSPNALALDLQPLDFADARSLASWLLPSQEMLRARAVALADGSPFMLLQLGQLALDRAGIGDELTLERLIEHRVAGLPLAAQNLLRVVALSATPLSPELLSEPAGLSGSALDSALRLLEAQRYVRPSATPPLRFEPDHDRIAEWLNGTTPAAARVQIHRKLARALERVPGHELAPALLFHHREAGDRERALHFAEIAVEQARARMSFHEAAALLADCAELTADEARRERYARARAEALVNAGRDHEAAGILQALARSAATREQRFALACEAAELFFRSGYASEAMQVLAPWLRALGLRPHATRAAQLGSVLYHRARSAVSGATAARPPAEVAWPLQARTELCLLLARGFGRTDLLRGFDYASRLLWHARRGATQSQLARALLLEAIVHANVSPASGRPEALLERARELFEPAADVVLEARWYAASAQCAALKLDRPKLDACAEQAVRLFEQHVEGLHMELAEARLMAVVARYGKGTLAVPEVQSLVHDAVQRGDRHTEANARMFLAVVQLASGRLEAAREELDRSLALSSQGRRQAQHFIGVATRARIELYTGSPGQARDRLVSALRAMALQGFALSPWLRIELRYLLALATIQAEGVRAYPQVAKIAHKLEGEKLLFPRLLADQLGAWLRAAGGERKRAAQALHVNASALERDGSAWYGMGSALLAHALEGRDEGRAELIRSLHARGVPAPAAFLTAYGPQWNANAHP